MNIILIGYRAVGKSTVAQEIAKRLQLQCVCLDHLIELAVGMSIASFVQHHGWPLFRIEEKKALQALFAEQKKSLSSIVLATGGGAVLDQDNVQILKQMGKIYWLQVDIAVIQQRLKRSLLLRPSLLEDTSSWEEAEQVQQQRSPLYRAAADVAFEVTHFSVKEIATMIIQRHKLLTTQERKY